MTSTTACEFCVKRLFTQCGLAKNTNVNKRADWLKTEFPLVYRAVLYPKTHAEKVVYFRCLTYMAAIMSGFKDGGGVSVPVVLEFTAMI